MAGYRWIVGAGCALLLLTLCACKRSAEAQIEPTLQRPAPQRESQEAREARREIGDRLFAGERLSPQDIDVLEGQTQSSDLVARASALVLLTAAADYGQYETSKVLAFCEQSAVEGTGLEPTLFAQTAAAALKIPNPESAMVQLSIDLRRQFSDPARITARERDAVAEFLASDDPATRALAGEVFVRFKGLAQSDRVWVGHCIESLAKDAEGKYSDYWQFVERVVAARHGP